MMAVLFCELKRCSRLLSRKVGAEQGAYSLTVDFLASHLLGFKLGDSTHVLNKIDHCGFVAIHCSVLQCAYLISIPVINAKLIEICSLCLEPNQVGEDFRLSRFCSDMNQILPCTVHLDIRIF